MSRRTKKTTGSALDTSVPAVRADRWLWAARFYKSRSLAAEACEGGKVEINGHTAKAHKLVRAADMLEFSHPHGPKKLKVRAVSEHRGPATEARLLYEDHSPPPPADVGFDFFGHPSVRDRGSGRPTKRERRETEWLRRR